MGQLNNSLRQLLKQTSKENSQPAILALEDGTIFRGFSCGSSGEVSGEICFNTGMVGYLEVITDPSYAGQIVTMTYPQIGNYGVCLDDEQRDAIALRGLVVRDMCTQPSNWRSTCSLPDYLARNNVVAIEGIDTRALVRHIRMRGAMRAVLSTIDLDAQSLVDKARAANGLNGVNHVELVSTDHNIDYAYKNAYSFAKERPVPSRYNIVAYDCGVKSAILDSLVEAGCKVHVVPWNTPAQKVLDMKPDGVFLSNGPGDPDTVEATFKQVKELLGKVPLFGICLGHQMLAKAAGAQIEKLKFGHRGINHPVMNLLTKRVEITVQNHGYSVVFSSLGPLEDKTEHVDDLREWISANNAPIVINDAFGRIELTHVNLNDGTIEGMRFLDVPAFSVQYHPEAAPGSTDSQYLFSAFTQLMNEFAGTSSGDDYLAIDRAQNRLQGWKLDKIASSDDKEVFHA